jgi:hypothetical protein
MKTNETVLTGNLKAIILMDVIARVSVHVFLPEIQLKEIGKG